ncbi:hypothetical protein [Chitinophaga japonensis]|uniref:Outer membrane protein with beta-barrel domain n=1 Tax=Chitinophaga japonensis TaxID=104662 RepID=A0A562SZ13_CHIJA|nr:hypothetical protein [Chitinophaga japonensis]TWI86512.1 hypothetical protein LX66_3770 [Chitinophaga japonensis]
MKKILSLAAVLLLCSSRSWAQEPAPAGEQPVYFVYATGQRTDQKLKVLIISTHILRGRNFAFPYQPTTVSMSLDFNEIITRIGQNERHFSTEYDNIHFNPVQVEELYGGYLRWNIQLQYHGDLTSSDNSLSAIEKVRAALIEDHIRKGYRVYQVRFTPLVDGENLSGYRYYDAGTSSYKNLVLDKVSPLSPLWITPYMKGDIKGILAGIGSSLDHRSSGGGIVIEDAGSSRKSSSYSSNSSSKKTSEDPDKWKRQAELNMWQAGNLEAEGDALYQRGTIFYPQALEKYRQAQQLYATSRVQSKINNINGLVGGVKLILDAGESVEKAIETADPQKKTRFVQGFVNYTGLLGSYGNITNPHAQNPMGAFFGFNGHRMFLSFETRIGYIVSPVYEYTVGGLNNTTTSDRVGVQQSSLGLGLSGGLNIPLRDLVIYGMYGFDLMVIPLSNEVLTPGFSLEDDPTFPSFITKWTFGAVYRFPRTRIGLGIQYNLNTIKGEEDRSEPVINNKYPDEHYYLRTTTDEQYKFNNAGVSFIWML